ncbi:MAG: hemolysin family protein [Candidatus Methanosuratincola sp.]|jgi:CBS domain containing-hemolysin-like protein
MSIEAVAAVIALCLLLQALFAGSEIALVSCDKVRMKQLSEQGSKSARLVLESFLSVERFISTSLVGINLCLIVSTTVLSYYIERTYHSGAELFTVLILSPLIVILGQVVPKAVFQRKSDSVILWAIYPLWAASKALSPILFFVDMFTKGILRAIGGAETPFITREELLQALRTGAPTPGRAKQEQIVRRIFDFSETRADEIMIPLINVKAISEEATVREAVRVIKETGHSRLPVYSERIDNITGMLHSFYLLGEAPDAPVKNFARTPYYVPEAKPVDELLDEMKKHRVGMAVVVDEYGGAVGIVTLEDILEEVVGEIEDEYDKGAKLWRKTGEGEYLVNPKVEIDTINEELGLDIPWGEYETLSGFLLTRFGSIPKSGDSITFGKTVFSITKATPRSIEEVKVTKKH